jgi:putative ABC transport system permease protein
MKLFFTAFFRLFSKHALQYLLNLLGLSIGLAVGIVVSVYVAGEYSYDKSYSRSGDIYRTAMEGHMGGNSFKTATSGGPFGKILFEEIPEVEQTTRLRPAGRPHLIRSGNEIFYTEDLIYTDSAFFEMFDRYDFIDQSARRFLNYPKTAVLTEEMAERLFGR